MFFCDSIASCWMDIGLNCPRMIRIALLGTLLFGVTPFEASSLALPVTALLTAAGVAALVPALRATRVDPIVALREE